MFLQSDKNMLNVVRNRQTRNRKAGSLCPFWLNENCASSVKWYIRYPSDSDKRLLLYVHEAKRDIFSYWQFVPGSLKVNAAENNETMLHKEGFFWGILLSILSCFFNTSFMEIFRLLQIGRILFTCLNIMKHLFIVIFCFSECLPNRVWVYISYK